MENLPVSIINRICEKILKNYQDDKLILPYVQNEIVKVKKFLSKKPNLTTFKPDKFSEYIINRIEERKVTLNTHVGVIAAQSIGEPVTQSALSYFHKLTEEEDNVNGLKELYNLTHNKIELSTVEFYLKPGKYDNILKKRILNSLHYTNLNHVVLDVVYNGFNLRFYLSSHMIFNLRMHPKTILDYIKDYLHKTNNILDTWDCNINLSNLYIEFIQPASKVLDWLDSNNIEYLVDRDILCIFKLEKEKDLSNYNLCDNGKDDGVENTSNINEYKNSENTVNEGEKFHSDSIINILTNDILYDYFSSNNINYEEKENYFIVDSHYIDLNIDDIKNLLENITLTGTKGVINVNPKFIGDEFFIEVVGTNLDPLFNTEYIDKDRSRYIAYGNNMNIDFNLRKENILSQLKRIVNVDSSSYNNQHIELLTNFMCRNNNSVTPMSRFGMNNNNYSFISQLSFEDPYNVIQNILYGVEDNLTSISAELITGIYQTDTKNIGNNSK